MTRQGFHTVDVARLEVAIKPSTPYNLVPNPSGALGAWGWITPDASYMTREAGTGADVLNHVVAAGVTNARFMTEPMPITGGHYAAAAFLVPPPVTIPTVTFRFEWLTSAYASISFSTASNAGGVGTYSLAAVQAPSNAAFFRLHFTQASSGTARITGVRAATAPTAAALVGDTLLNRVTNPSFEVNLTGWTAAGNTSIARTTAAAHVGSASMQLNNPIPGPQLNSAYSDTAVEGGKDYTLSARFNPFSSGGYPYLSIAWLDAGGGSAGGMVTSQGAVNSTPPGSWTLFSMTATAPPGAVTARVTVGHANPPSGYTRVDAVAFHDGTSPTYFDGTTAAVGTYTYAWTGTAHASASKRTNTNLTGLAAVEWRNLIGPTHSIKVARESLNVGTLEAELLDANLDPATSSTLRPGGAVRLLALVGGVWEPLFVGETDRLTVQYDDKRRPVRPPRVSLTAVDMTRRLAGAQRTQGVGEVAHLPHVLEGAGVPWNVDGSTAQLLAAPTVVSVNDNATALDQIALTRDSKAAHAWVDRKGALVARSSVSDVFYSDPTAYTTTRFKSWAVRTALQNRIGQPVVVTLDLRTDAPTGINVYPYQNSGISIADSKIFNVTPTWATYSFVTSVKDWTVGAGLSQGELAIYDPSDAGGNVYVRNVRIETGPVRLLDEPRYSDLEVAFSSEACINAVEIEALILVPAETPTGGLYYKTEAVPYGPFEDAASIAQWGRRSRKFTVHGLNSSQASALADAILVRNANPEVTVSSVTLPMRTSTDLADTLRDLGEIVQVQSTARGISPTMRVTSVEHSIESEPRKWLTTLGFTTSGSVASPTVAPEVQTSPGFGDTDWITPTLENGWTHFDASAPVQYRRKDGVVYLRGLTTGGVGGTQAFALPPGFRGKWLRGNSHWPVVNTDGSGFVRVWSNGSVGPAQSGGYIDLGSIAFIAEQ